MQRIALFAVIPLAVALGIVLVQSRAVPREVGRFAPRSASSGGPSEPDTRLVSPTASATSRAAGEKPPALPEPAPERPEPIAAQARLPRHDLPHGWAYREIHLESYMQEAVSSEDLRDRYRCFDMLARLSISTILDDLGMHSTGMHPSSDLPATGYVMALNDYTYDIPIGMFPGYDDFRTHWEPWSFHTERLPEAPLPPHVEEAVLALGQRAKDVLGRY